MRYRARRILILRSLVRANGFSTKISSPREIGNSRSPANCRSQPRTQRLFRPANSPGDFSGSSSPLSWHRGSASAFLRREELASCVIRRHRSREFTFSGTNRVRIHS